MPQSIYKTLNKCKSFTLAWDFIYIYNCVLYLEVMTKSTPLFGCGGETRLVINIPHLLCLFLAPHLFGLVECYN